MLFNVYPVLQWIRYFYKNDASLMNVNKVDKWLIKNGKRITSNIRQWSHWLLTRKLNKI